MASGEACRAQIQPAEPGPYWEGPYTPIPVHMSGSSQHCCEIAHAILIGKRGSAQGKVLIIQSNGDRWTWDPAAPSSISSDPVTSGVQNLFCAGHSVDGEGNVVVHGGNRHVPNGMPPSCPQTTPFCGPQPKWSYVLDPRPWAWSQDNPMLTPSSPAIPNHGYWYPGSVRLHDGRVISIGGGSSPLTTFSSPNTCCDSGFIYYTDGWQLFDQGSWIGSGNAAAPWYPGLPGTNEFNYYPLAALLPRGSGSTLPGYVFSAVVTNNRTRHNGSPGYVPVPGVSAVMDLGGSWPQPTAPATTAWANASQMVVPGTSVPVNLYYPSGFLWPLTLDMAGLPIGPVKYVVVGGVDNNVADYLPQPQPAPLIAHGGRLASALTWLIQDPIQPTNLWSATTLQPMAAPRVYANVVLLPNGKAFVVGGSFYDHYPFGAGAPGVGGGSLERVAVPVTHPEILDLIAGGGWQQTTPHESARLYHSVALLLRDGRVLVGGGYRGSTLPASGTPTTSAHMNHMLPHSDFEIYVPDYIASGERRPEIQEVTCGDPAISVGGSEGGSIGHGSTFELTVAYAGSSTPALDIGSISLVSCGAVTHHFDWDQRFLWLPFVPSTSSPDNKLTVTAPANGSVAPPGWYLLFINTTDRVPSLGMFVHLQ